MENRRMKNIIFNVILIASILIVVLCFEYARNFRHNDQIGSEFFTLALPLLIVEYKFSKAERKINRLKKKNKALQKCM
jgi:hypothetical protein